MKDSKYNLGNRVELTSGPHEGEQGEIVKMDAGWYHVQTDDGDIVKARAAGLMGIADDDEEPADDITEADLAEAEGDLEEALTAAQQMAETLRKARVRYSKTRRPNGTHSADCADAIAKELRDLEPLDVCVLADKVMGEPIGTHEGKYAALNNGQKRMNSGNRIRAAFKKALEAGDQEEITRIADIVGIDLPGAEDDEEAGE